ncbi:MAG: cob(I)yrinic acid a,c-diamide adenosyltransferase [Flectobacillus sp.]|uniref:cob(I)yrinic acid a,c-diamide adenosyltransferase n=1 Tax=Flectobacillus sp. TaxID=50419 RepID=UPI003B9B4490
MKIYTKSGDRGTTSLVGGTRISKAELRIEAYGTVDELNAYIGLLGDFEVNFDKKAFLKEIQDRLFTIGSILASEPEQTKKQIPDLHESDIEALEKAMDVMNESLEPMRFFILPGGHQHVSFGHVARTVCRRAERQVVRLAEENDTDYLVIRYLNRLSDYLFILCRFMARQLGVAEVAWKARV